MLGLATQSGSGDGEGGAAATGGGEQCSGGGERCNNGGDSAGRTTSDDGGCFGTILEWFWEHKLHGQNIEKNVWKIKDDEFSYYLRNKSFL